MSSLASISKAHGHSQAEAQRGAPRNTARQRGLSRPAAVAAGSWLGFVAVCSVLAPVLASGHPVLMRELDSAGSVVRTTSPLLAHLSAADIALLIGAPVAGAWVILSHRAGGLGRLAAIAFAGLQMAATFGLVAIVHHAMPDVGVFVNAGLSAGLVAIACEAVRRCGFAIRPGITMLVAALCLFTFWMRWDEPLARFDYRQREARGEVRCTYTLIPFSPQQGDPALYFKPPGSHAAIAGDGSRPPVLLLGTDGIGQDVLSQLLHACRLSLSVGLLSTGIAVLIGVCIGALAGFFGGWVDVILQRLIEIFMSIPVLFLLIVTAGSLPPGLRSTYVMMAVIGAVSWTGAARFTRAEFLKLRTMDYIQAARAAGLPTRSILFRHMLPNGVTPVLVDASFSVAAAILAEATLSFLGLGPIDQPSWGKLLAGATGVSGEFVWWLAVIPGGVVFLTVLSTNTIGRALRDMLDPTGRGSGREP